MTNHRNDERTVRCPVDGCDATPLARGINLHLRRSSGDGHGPQGEVPDHISTDQLETVGEREVQMDYPAERDNEKHARLCPYCSQTFEGAQGIMTHLTHTEGRQNHPENAAAQHTVEDFPRVEVDQRGNVRRLIGNDRSPTNSPTGNNAVPKERVYRLIADFMAQGETEAANRVRRHLLDGNVANRSLRENPDHVNLFHKLVIHSQAGDTDHSLTAAVEREGIMVACRGTSAFYNAAEARDVAAGLERATSDDPRDEEIAALIEFLRYGAGRLDNDNVVQGFHEEFQRWR